MLIGVGICDAPDRVQESEFPQHTHEGAQSDTWFATLDTVQGTSTDVARLRQFFRAHSAPYTCGTHALPKLLKMLHHFARNLDICILSHIRPFILINGSYYALLEMPTPWPQRNDYSGESAEDNLAELVSQAQTFADKRLPILKALQVA